MIPDPILRALGSITAGKMLESSARTILSFASDTDRTDEVCRRIFAHRDLILGCKVGLSGCAYAIGFACAAGVLVISIDAVHRAFQDYKGQQQPPSLFGKLKKVKFW